MNAYCRKVLLEERIKWNKRRMHIVAKRHGLSSRKTVKCSQKLDILLNHYQKIQ
ncbi:aspartyl-phosphate phosphatase Spo0E family protein [Bacillus sp. FJAT-44742]|uniref:aspartyl-phosphate phosphatase Spo0E family protein n=1 Tax=Bacillus sp. FJAT-44742 TaxID=2014005 RepID=UPI000C24EE2B|nr:aspartyl-phosphate phosphatase Spo0E family protein [Bacillus sp. FJAT-44742]